MVPQLAAMEVEATTQAAAPRALPWRMAALGAGALLAGGALGAVLARPGARVGASLAAPVCSELKDGWSCESARGGAVQCRWRPTPRSHFGGICVEDPRAGECSKVGDHQACRSTQGCMWTDDGCRGCGYSDQCSADTCVELPEDAAVKSNHFFGPTTGPRCFPRVPASCRSKRLQASQHACLALRLAPGSAEAACQWETNPKGGESHCHPLAQAPHLVLTEEEAARLCSTLTPRQCQGAAPLCQVVANGNRGLCASKLRIASAEEARATCPQLNLAECRYGQGKQWCEWNGQQCKTVA